MKQCTNFPDRSDSKNTLEKGFSEKVIFQVSLRLLITYLQAEAQEAVIHDVSHLCDVAEAMCYVQDEQLKQSFIDLPIWGSPRELMASLCDE